MNTNQIKPAISIQKVKHIPTGAVAELLDTTGDGTVLCVRFNQLGERWLAQWIARDCEPVEEESKPLRIGDKVTLPSWGSNATRYGIITGIESQQGYDKKTYYVDGDLLFHTEEVRLSTPEEVRQYFN